MSDKVIVRIAVSKEEREWINGLAKMSRSSIPFMIIELLEGKSRIFGIPIPPHPKRLKRYSQAHSTARQLYMERMDKELGL